MNDRSSMSNLHPHRGTHRQLSLLAIVFALVLAAMPASMFAQIQLDGNAKKVDGSGATGTDWDEVNCPNSSITSCVGLTAGGGSIAKTGLVIDRPEPNSGFTQFSTGGSKDEQNITAWRHRSGTPPSKDDLSHAFAAAFTRASDSHTILAFGMDRYDTSGDAQLGFWFLAENPQPVASGIFVKSGTTIPAQHQNGDLLVLANFSNGGDVPTIQVFKWLNGAAVSQGIAGAVACSGGDVPAVGFCGVTNAGPVAAPWTYDNKDSGPTAQFPRGAFFEGGIDLTALSMTGCFTGFIAESRSSTSITATLKDFADPGNGFNLCNISVTKDCVNPVLNAAQTHIIYTIQGQVTNGGAGTLYNITLSDNPNADPAGTSELFNVVDCATKSTVSGSFPLTSLAGGALPVCYKATMTVPIAENGRSDTVTLTANTESDGSGTVLTQTDTAVCPNLQVNPSLSVTKTCSTSVEVDPATNKVVVKVTISGDVCNTGDSALTGVTVVDEGLNITLVNGVTLQSTEPDSCQHYSTSYYPSAANSSTPAEVVFSDTVKATAVDILNHAVPNKDTAPPQPDVTATATCRLCPTCPTCPAP